MMDRQHLYIGGQWVPPHGTGTIAVENPTTEQVIAHVPAADASDVDSAVAAAREAFAPWAALAPQQRASHLARLHEALAKRADDIAATIVTDLGAPIKIALRVHTQVPLIVLKSYADLAARSQEVETIGNSLVLREPIGVAGAITPWNYPLHQVVAKVGAALAAGCTVVLKPAELTPLAVYQLFDAVHEAGLPPGVLNLVTGLGHEAGEALARHPDVDMVSFTGSTATGAHISRLAADRIARVALELGGKSANVILDAVRIANNSRYGLAGAVWSADPDRALAVAKRLRTGAVDINGGAFNPLAPFGGYKQSGIGRELGAHGLSEFLETKAIQR